MPTHFKSICSIIDKWQADLDFEVSEVVESGLSQGLESHPSLDQSNYHAASLLEDADCQSSRAASRDITPDTSLPQGVERAFES